MKAPFNLWGSIQLPRWSSCSPFLMYYSQSLWAGFWLVYQTRRTSWQHVWSSLSVLILLKQKIPFVLCTSHPFFPNKRNLLWQGFRNTISPQKQLRYWQGRREKKHTVWLKSYHKGSLGSQHHPANSCKMLLFFWNYFKNPIQDHEEAQWTGITTGSQDCSINLIFNNETALHMYYQFPKAATFSPAAAKTQMWHSCDMEPSCSTQFGFLQDPAPRNLWPGQATVSIFTCKWTVRNET